MSIIFKLDVIKVDVAKIYLLDFANREFVNKKFNTLYNQDRMQYIIQST